MLTLCIIGVVGPGTAHHLRSDTMMIPLIEHSLNPLVEACEDILAAAWSLHRHETDILILADMGRDDIPRTVRDFWSDFGRPMPTRTVEGRVLSAALQPAGYTGLLDRGGWAQREASEELRGFAAARRGGVDVVPLFVVIAGGHWATMWSPPGSPVVAIRHEPVPDPEATEATGNPTTFREEMTMGQQSRRKRLRRLGPVGPADAAEFEAAADRGALLGLNEFRIRALKKAAVDRGYGADAIVLLLDLRDPYARQVHDELHGAGRLGDRLGQPLREGDDLQMICLHWTPFRELFSPNHRAIFDRARADDIRVAILSGGHTQAAILPGDCKWDDTPVALLVQTASDVAAGYTEIPRVILDQLDRQGREGRP
jgi:hypothetical protein